MSDDGRYEDHDEPGPTPAKDIDPSALRAALGRLAGFSDAPVLARQAFHLALIDNLLNGLEDAVLRADEDDRAFEQAALLAAMSPMWIYAAYELVRTWRQRCEEVILLADNGGLSLRADHLGQDLPYRHYDRELRAEQLRTAKDEPQRVDAMRLDLRRTEMAFKVLEFVRVALAKHEVSAPGKKRQPIALAPDLALMDRETGSMKYEMSNGGSIIDFVTRRNLADSLRALPDLDVPSDQDLEGFRQWIGPPDVTGTGSFGEAGKAEGA
jgi:hypothetical protein